MALLCNELEIFGDQAFRTARKIIKLQSEFLESLPYFAKKERFREEIYLEIGWEFLKNRINPKYQVIGRGTKH